MTCSTHLAKLPSKLSTLRLHPLLASHLTHFQNRLSAPTVISLSLTLLISACGGGGSADTIQTPPNDDPTVGTNCETGAQNQWVYDNMLDYYLFYDQVPVVDPQAYSSPESLIQAIRFEELDPYSYITSASSSALQFDEGRSFGLGFRWGRDAENDPRLISVLTDSPFGRAGLERGDTIISVNQIPWYELTNDYFNNSVVGSPDTPATSIWKIEKRDSGQIIDVDISATEYAINTVLHKQFFNNASYGGTIGYVAFSSFLETSRDELNAVFQEFNDNDITDLVLDLRYNGGGRVSIAAHLASLIAGNSHSDSLLYEYEFNDKYTANNYALYLQKNVGDLNLSRVIVLTRGNTASASEIVISGLQPYLEVVTIGSTTSGKPYIQLGRDRCGSRLNAIEAEGVNAAGANVFGGIPASCNARDDRTKNFGIDVETGKLEGMLESALDYIVFGSCETLLPQAELSTPSREARGKFDGIQATDESEKQGVEEIVGAFR